MKLDGKTILVTGSNRGIGAALVRELLKHKVGKIYAAARDTAKLPEFNDSRVVPLALDVTNTAQLSDAVAKAGDVNILVNNAGTAQFGGVLGNTLESIQADMNTNYYGTLNVTRAFAPVIQKNGHGQIATVSSIVGLANMAMAGSYSASKAAVHSLIQSLRGELAGKNVQVLGIYPGPIDTDMAKGISMAKASVETTAQNIVAGLIAGEEYIFPDSISQEWGALWLKDPQGLEKLFAPSAADLAQAG